MARSTKEQLTKKTVVDLPPDVTEADTKYDVKRGGLGYDDLKNLGMGFDGGFNGVLTFYRTERFGWVLCTLPIRSAGRRGHMNGQTDRTYGITIKDEGLVTVGIGPHVLAKVDVWLNKANVARLKSYLDLWKKGMAKAGDTRDRISTRRANTIARRDSLPPWWSQ